MKLLSKFGDIKATYLTWLEARIGKSLVTAEKNSVTGGITKIAVVTQAQYDALVAAGTVDANTEYNIVSA